MLCSKEKYIYYKNSFCEHSHIFTQLSLFKTDVIQDDCGHIIWATDWNETGTIHREEFMTIMGALESYNVLKVWEIYSKIFVFVENIGLFYLNTVITVVTTDY